MFSFLPLSIHINRSTFNMFVSRIPSSISTEGGAGSYKLRASLEIFWVTIKVLTPWKLIIAGMLSLKIYQSELIFIFSTQPHFICHLEGNFLQFFHCHSGPPQQPIPNSSNIYFQAPQLVYFYSFYPAGQIIISIYKAFHYLWKNHYQNASN